MDKRFLGSWRITETAVWAKDVLDLLGPANITFDDDGLGSFRFIAVVGFTDCRFSEHDGNPFVEFSWQGNDDNDETCGRGWAEIYGDGKMRGHIYIHCADDSSFIAKKG